MSKMVSEKQARLFESLSTEGELIFACGPSGVSANLVGHFSIRQYREGEEDRLDLGDGTNHVHIDWSKITHCEFGDFHGEGMVTFLNGEEIVFRFYRPAGVFSESTQSFAGSLL